MCRRRRWRIKELAYGWIDATLGAASRRLGGFGEAAAAPAGYSFDPRTTRSPLGFTEQFDTLLADDKLSCFPDYPVTGLATSS